MKIVSFKNIAGALAALIIALILLIRMDYLSDLVWIALFLYIAFKGFELAFSKEAYDKNKNENILRKAFYLKTFGAFGFFAADIPFILILFAGALSYYCHTTSGLRVIIILILFSAVIYIIWINIYISKNEKILKRRGAWENQELNDREARAWKQYDIFHNIVFTILAIGFAVCFLIGDPFIYINNSRLSKSVADIDSDEVTLEEVVPFEWTTVYKFDPYTPLKVVKRITNSDSPALKESVNEGMVNLVFKNYNRVVASICAYPSNTGYDIYFTRDDSSDFGSEVDSDVGWASINYGDRVKFNVSMDNSVISLNADAE